MSWPPPSSRHCFSHSTRFAEVIDGFRLDGMMEVNLAISAMSNGSIRAQHEVYVDHKDLPVSTLVRKLKLEA
ncbi:hypothetical protein T4E_10207 [Trichinella pseudospiralis]|uniref:Uncharacterized protein n=1 Tax=Trichinella pseudospiralis TaxID=6337 RepID=A0A0V0XYR9_TRIPS|nr:hypothetical protein T4E_10207 [Trichinella pseudospiralis]